MTKSVYSFNGSSLHLLMDDILAERYNHAVKAWFLAQVDFKKLYDRNPTANDISKLLIVMSEEDSN